MSLMNPSLPLLRAAAGILLLAQLAAPAPAESILLRGGVIHTVAGRALTNASLLARDGRIAAIGSDLSADDAQVVELNGMRVYPGFIAPLATLGLTEIDSVRATRDMADVGDFTPDVYAWVAVHTDSELIPVARANGYACAQAVPSGGVISGHSALFSLAGWTIEDVAIQKAAALHVRWPSFTLNTPSRDRSNNLENQVRERDRRIQAIDDFFSEAEAYARLRAAAASESDSSSPLPGEGTLRKFPDGAPVIPAWEAMLPALRGEIPVFIHADETRQIRSAVEWAVKRKLRVVIAGGRDAWRVAQTLARENIPVVFDKVFTLPARDTDTYDVHYSAPAKLARAGVKVSFGGGESRLGSSDIRNIPYAAAQAVAFGLPAD